jgi:hypothetical protein
MKFKPRKVAFPVLLVFILGIATVNVHATSHLSAEASECNQCSAYSDPIADDDCGNFEINASMRKSFGCEHPPELTENGSIQHLFARGPPESPR